MTSRPCSRAKRRGAIAGILLGLAAAAPGQTPDFFAPATGTTQTEAERDAQVLDQFVVVAAQVPGRHWRYASLPGYEVLSRCDDAQNAYYLAALERENRVEAAMLPADLLTPLAARNSVILYDRQPAAGELAFTIPEPSELASDDAAVWGRYSGHHLAGSGVGEDRDTRADCLNLWGRGSDQALYTTRALSTRLLHRTPTLPAWFVQGLIGPAGVYKRGYRFITPDGAEDRTETFAYFPAAFWVSDGVTADLRGHPEAAVTFLPVGELFRPRREWTDLASPLEASELSLFVRWGLFAAPKEPAHRAAFLRFVERSGHEPVAEALFRDCFGFGFAQAETQLRGYLPKALATGVRLRVSPKGNPTLPAFRKATSDEVARLIGDWERINALAFQADYPSLAQKYLSAAGLFLEKRAKDGSRDPQFLGVYGLYRHDRDDDARARPALEAAARDPSARPNVLVTLARLRLDDPAEAGDPTTAAGIRELLERARRRPPDLVESYQIAGELAARAGQPLSHGERAMLQEGRARFPRDRALAELADRLGVPAGQ